MNREVKDISIILTYRCNARCDMCNVWKNPSVPAEEITLQELDKIPFGINNINLTGGEPTLRSDLADIVDLLRPRAAKFEISSNGLLPEKLYPIIKKHPDVMVRFSLEGFEETSNLIRGEKDGFQTKVNGLRRLQELGGKNLGFAITIQDENADQLVRLFEFADKNGFELATSTVHNGFQFHKNDNVIYDRLKTAGYIEELITAQLKTFNVKKWFRGYLNLGIVARVLGQARLLPCLAAIDFIFLDPWGGVYACNVRPDLKIGDLVEQTWDEIVNGQAMNEVRQKVTVCKQHCWMVGSAKTAMRNSRFVHLPGWAPLIWVAENKLRLMLGGKINFSHYVDHAVVYRDPIIHYREPYASSHPVAKRVQRREDAHYIQPGGYDNR